MKTKQSAVSVPADVRPSGRHAESRTAILALAAAWLLAGCVNVHVHFPAAPDAPLAADKPGKNGAQ
jgi:hypothetical protein